MRSWQIIASSPAIATKAEPTRSGRWRIRSAMCTTRLHTDYTLIIYIMYIYTNCTCISMHVHDAFDTGRGCAGHSPPGPRTESESARAGIGTWASDGAARAARLRDSAPRWRHPGSDGGGAVERRGWRRQGTHRGRVRRPAAIRQDVETRDARTRPAPRHARDATRGPGARSCLLRRGMEGGRQLLMSRF